METNQDVKRPRLDSWGGASSTHTQSTDPHPSAYSSSAFSPQSPYSAGRSSMAVWDSKGNVQPGQHTVSDSRSRSVGHITPPQLGGYGHPMSANPHSMAETASNMTPGYSSFQAQPPNSHHVVGGDQLPPERSPSQVQRQLQLKPLQTAPHSMFHDPGFYAHPASSVNVPGDPRHSAGAELESPGSSGTSLPPGPGPMVATGVYGTAQSPLSHQASLSAGGIATPVSAGPGSLHMGQGVGVVTTYPPRRKAIRAAQACDACRARKAKCDEGRPSCGFCKETQVQCVYREVPPPKQDRTLQQILDRLRRVEEKLDTVNARMDPSENVGGGKPANLPAPDIATTVLSEHSFLTNLKRTPPLYDPRPLAPASAAVILENQRQARTPVEAPIEGDDQLTIPYKHTTAAHKLMNWPCIRKLIDNEFNGEENYIIEEEEKRGPLRVYGKGEATTVVDERVNMKDVTAAGPGEVRELKWEPETGKKTPRHNSAPQEPVSPELDSAALSGDSGLDASGDLKLDHQTVLKYLNSFLSVIHILHPILDKPSITKKAFGFADRVRSSTAGHSPAASGLGPTAVPEKNIKAATGKRKRGASGSATAANAQVASSENKTCQQAIPTTVHSALVLLVLALGAICLHRTPVPGPLDAQSTSRAPFTGPRAQQRPAARRFRREVRNIDFIPGLAYFAKALEILGLLVGGNDLEHVQAALLAGLYWGQLGRVMDSWKWISMACMSCQILVKMKLDPLDRDPLRKDLILRSFWSCLQLESDVLAELDLPPSGVSRLEDSMTFPTGEESPSRDTETPENDPLLWMYYLAQASLRRLLNRVHTALYRQDTAHLDSPRSFAIARELDHQLNAWKSTLPEPLRWEEDSPPSPDLNAARLRAKYYGARYIIHRPFVYHALHKRGGIPGHSPGSPALSMNEISQRGSPATASTPLAAGTGSMGGGIRGASLAGSGEERADLTSSGLEMNCRKCLESAIHSTTAFHAFPPEKNRPIITNVFGTAHAQFGNLLVLQAAYHSPMLRPMIPAHVLGQLLDQTIRWFETLAPISPALRRDIEILENTASKLDFPLPQRSH